MKEEIEKILNESDMLAWQGAANAFRMYPNSRHTYADYKANTKDNLSQEVEKLEALIEREAVNFAEWILNCNYKIEAFETSELFKLYKEQPQNKSTL